MQERRLCDLKENLTKATREWEGVEIGDQNMDELWKWAGARYTSVEMVPK